MSGIISALLPNVDAILGVRDQIGAALKPVKLITRTWSGSEPGDGTASETAVDVLPSPAIQEYAHDHRIHSGGVIQQGDILLKYISKNAFPLKATVACESTARNVEKFYEVGGDLYQVIHVKEDYLTWNVQVRRLTDQTRY